MLFSLLLLTNQAHAQPPPGWILAGSVPEAYVAELDEAVAHSGGNSARYASVKPRPRGFGTMMQSFAPDDYVGERVRLSAWIKAEEVQGWAGLWMRVDGTSASEATLAFDNMSSRPIKGTQDWQHVEIVLDVDDSATNIAFGVLLSGAGMVWLDDLSFEVVDLSVTVTDMLENKHYEPANMDFED